MILVFNNFRWQIVVLLFQANFHCLYLRKITLICYAWFKVFLNVLYTLVWDYNWWFIYLAFSIKMFSGYIAEGGSINQTPWEISIFRNAFHRYWWTFFPFFEGQVLKAPSNDRNVLGRLRWLWRRQRGQQWMVGWHHWLNGHEFE